MENIIGIGDLISYIYETPKNITYISIGCSNLRYPKEVPPESDRQQYPLFLDNMIKNNKLTARIILIDPLIESPPSIFSFFETIYEGYYENLFICDPGNVEVIIIKDRVEHKNNQFGHTEMMFFELLNLHVLDYNGLLFVQDFTGANILPVQDHFYRNLPQQMKSLFAKKILYDFTYGLNYGCMVDLASPDNQPIIVKNAAGEIEIFNYLYDNHLTWNDLLGILPQIHIQRILKERTKIFKNKTYCLFRQIKLLLYDNTKNINIAQFDEYIFIEARLDCYAEYNLFLNNPSNHEIREKLSLKLNDQIKQQCFKVISDFGSIINQDDIFVLFSQIDELNEKTIYTWLSSFDNLINKFAHPIN